MDETMMSGLASGFVGGVISGIVMAFAIYILRSGLTSLRRARMLTVETALGDVGRSIRDLHDRARAEGRASLFFSAKKTE